MVWGIAVGLLLIWAFAWATSHTLGGLIHVLALTAAALLLARLARKRKPLEWLPILPRYRPQRTKGFMLRSKIVR